MIQRTFLDERKMETPNLSEEKSGRGAIKGMK